MTLQEVASKGDLGLLQQLLDQEGFDVDSIDNFGRTALSKAAESGHLECVVELVQRGANVDHVASGDGRTPLFLACEGRFIEIARYLVTSAGATVDAYDVYHRAAIHIVCENNDIETLRVLLEAKAWVEFPCIGGMTPLLIAAERGFTEIVRLLLVDYGAQAWTENYDGESALYLAACNGHVDCLRVIHEHRRRAVQSVPRRRGKRPSLRPDMQLQDLVGAAFHHGHVESFAYLIDAGYPFDSSRCRLTSAALQGNLEIVRYMVESLRMNINQTTSDWEDSGITALFNASAYGHTHVVEYLLSRGADVTTTHAGTTPLHVARNRRIAEMLLPYISSNAVDDSGCTPLFTAARDSLEDVVECLLAAGALPGHQNSNNDTPLFVAATKGIAQRLLEAGVDRNVLNNDRQAAIEIHTSHPRDENLEVVQCLLTPEAIEVNTRALCTAAQRGYLTIVRLLLDAGALANGNSDDGQPLYNASESGREHVVRCLLQAGANVDISIDGNTPLIIAVANERSDVLPLLIEADSSLTATDEEGNTVFHHAARLGRSDIMLELIDARDRSRLDFSVDIQNNDGRSPFSVLWEEAHHETYPMIPRKFHATAVALMYGGATQWELLPEPCPGLCVVLLKVWRTRPDDMPQLFSRLLPEEQEKVRQMLRCLKRVEKSIEPNFEPDIRMQLVQTALLP